MNKSLKWKALLIVIIMALAVWKLIPLKDALNLGLDLQGGTYLTLGVLTDKLPADQKKDACQRVLEIIRNRIDEFGVAEASVQKGSGDRIIIQIPGIGTEGSKRIKDIIKRQAHLEFKLVVDDPEMLKNAQAGNVSPSFFNEYEILEEEHVNEMGQKKSIPMLVTKKAYVTGDTLVDSRVDFSSSGFGEVQVLLEFNKKGDRAFAKVTGENVNKRLAIVLDNKVQSAPNITQKITGGRASITGSFTIAEANDLAIALRAGALPAPVEFIQESTVGPTLGSDSIRKGVQSAIWGLISVMLFMAIYYLFFGLIANFALIFNIILLLSILSYFNATLTLPGIAGIILTIGMAVDANVLVFERIREELKTGKSPKPALEAGYNKAFLTILDANITTLLTAFILLNFGTGPIKGFAITLIIGIIASFFTALFVTRTIFDIGFTKFNIKKLSI
ncbi:protein translocase subunit SecD [bacterium]|nr:protein translocase subunit SecD [bacterium]